MSITVQAIDAADERVALMRRSLKRLKFRLEEVNENCNNVLGEIDNIDDSLSRVRETEAYGGSAGDDEDRVAEFNKLLNLLDVSVDELAERADEAVSLDDNLEASRYVLNNIASGVSELE